MLAAAAVLLHGDTAFSWARWPIHPSTAIGCALFLGLYFMAVGPWRLKYNLGSAPALGQLISFTSGVIVIFVALNGPLHELADNYLFSAHMVQHLMLTLLMPPLLLVGTPTWLARLVIRKTVGLATARILTRPLIAFALYNIVLAGWHFPQFYNWALEDHNVHIAQHLMFMVTATLVWWPVADPVPELSHMQPPVRLLYLFALSIPMSMISALITLSETVLYGWYEAAPRVFNLSTLGDQQLGGLIMWVPGALVYWIAISILYFRWSSKEDREEAAHRAALARS